MGHLFHELHVTHQQACGLVFAADGRGARTQLWWVPLFTLLAPGLAWATKFLAARPVATAALARVGGSRCRSIGPVGSAFPVARRRIPFRCLGAGGRRRAAGHGGGACRLLRPDIGEVARVQLGQGCDF
ncbi:hypothetical protein SDC9_209385 [bioreactor metagenome]|uniref:Uncharacterized protein n=1 Tax=bioreactor metagenome TaxID=1076179 RepID=A0A645JE86_9ZZZZ